MKTINLTNTPIRNGETVTVDHVVTEFKVVVRTSSSHVGPESITDLIQKKYEVVKCEEVDQQVYVRPPSTPDCDYTPSMTDCRKR